MKVLFLLPALALAACSDVTAPGRNAPSITVPTAAAYELITNEKIAYVPFDPITNPCNGETLTLSGETHHMLKVSTAKDGSLKVTESYRSHFSGVGSTTLAKYEGTDLISERDVFSDGAGMFTTKRVLHLEAQGKVPDFYLEFTSSLSFDASGNFTFSDSDPKTRCKQ